MIDKGKNYTFWSLATGRRTPPRYPSRVDFDLKPNQHLMTRLFPSGRAFFITPSFVISDPIKFCEFMQWFGGWCHNPRYLLATSADFPSWLQGLCMEKSQEWTKYQQGHSGEPGFAQVTGKYGLTKDRTDALVKAWQILRKIMDYGDEETHRDVQKVMWAPREINPNDEQSLVNWFLWWSTMFLDRHRRFYVLGSSAKHRDRAYRTVRIPNYDPDQTLDPDELTEKNRPKKEAEEQEILGFWEALAVGQDPAMTTNMESSDTKANILQGAKPPPKAPAAHSQGSFISQAELGFPTKMFKSDRAFELNQWLTNLQESSRIKWTTPFRLPVSWLDIPMADHFGDPRCDYANFTHWLSACSKFWKGRNTWVGLFYTPDGVWDPAKPPNSYRRHPWIAIYRPVNPHINQESYNATELLIWDVAAER